MPSSKKNLLASLPISLALHGAVAAALALYLNHAPAPDELAQLDLTSVELSFAETVEETAAAAASVPSVPVETAPLPPPVEAASLPPPADATSPVSPADAAHSPRQAETKLPSPTEMPEHLPPAIAKAEDARPAAAAAAPRQARVDAPAKPRRAIRPDYPRESRLRGEHGDVALELDIAADGTVTTVRILRSPGYPLLEEAAVRAARAARFTPAKSDGQSVASTVRLTLDFRLR